MINIFNEQEFITLKAALNNNAEIIETTIEYNDPNYFTEIKNNVKKDRRGEIVFAVIRPNGKIIAVRSEVYPEGIFRIPTGGINYNEDIFDAVKREVKEELGLTFKLREFSGVIKITFKYKEEKVHFYSYVFFLEETGGRLLEDALEDEVSEIVEADNAKLQEIVDKLLGIRKDWGDWGQFRALTTGYVLKKFAGMQKKSE